MYHNTVGRNCKLMLDLAVAQTGRVDPQHARRYKQLGDWVRQCYGHPIPAQGNFTCQATQGGQTECHLDFGREVVVDRVVLREELRYGQLVREWSMSAEMEWGDCAGCVLPIPSAQGQSIGNKRIALWGEALLVRQIYLLHHTERRGGCT